jgi:hypothetical protein
MCLELVRNPTERREVKVNMANWLFRHRTKGVEGEEEEEDERWYQNIAEVLLYRARQTRRL